MRDLDDIWWSSTGDGASVVVPWLNVDWSEIDLSALTERFRVVMVAPAGFGPSARPGSYDGAGFSPKSKEFWTCSASRRTRPSGTP